MSKVPESVRKELAALAQKPESEIDFSDIPETSAADWAGAERGRFYRPVKKSVTMRLDADVLEWLKSEGEGYQTRVNALLRKEMLTALGARSGETAPEPEAKSAPAVRWFKENAILKEKLDFFDAAVGRLHANRVVFDASNRMYPFPVRSEVSPERLKELVQEYLSRSPIHQGHTNHTVAAGEGVATALSVAAASGVYGNLMMLSSNLERTIFHIRRLRPDVPQERILAEATVAAQESATVALTDVLEDLDRRASRHEELPWERH